ncbi:LOW QUALITY PROTEIN: probable ubiquitin-like-specific protease 2B [Sorghum bicolor]|uniref:LOW QUALITY PROTEIN: probable ubiquitin-like-specific protease 2B n=1 Tax=Sorghum bicolor TaxID=4558 RepID=UPI000B425FAD|nr:LOW QUALITY PROTEIN: probable ubiquitin-like-specific protease 2B [Sorghum bicolor]|eukprot:XP_021316611.1 LOW QUALITY PROTEIN: probable ubiquitin-like-specific protease 2B [Sorghum bicolor]
MSRRGREKGQAVLIDLDSDAEEECQSKRPRTRRTTTLKTSGRSKNVLPSFYDNLPQSRVSSHATSRRNKTNQDKLNTDIFELYMEDLWKHIDEDKKSAYAYLDSLWFNMYYHGSNIPNVLKWIKAKRIFSRQYVFVPIVCFGHWSLLVLCHFDDANCSDFKKGPRMIVLDSLNTTDPTRLQSAIRKFIADIYKTEEREESKQFINKIRLEFPKVPQQNGDECGIYVLYFIHVVYKNKKLADVLENKKLEEDFTQLLDDSWFNPEELENFRKDIHSFQANRNNKIAE